MLVLWGLCSQRATADWRHDICKGAILDHLGVSGKTVIHTFGVASRTDKNMENTASPSQLWVMSVESQRKQLGHTLVLR